MTNITAATISPDNAAPVDVPDIGFSVPELVYLLNSVPGPVADRSAEIFSVGPLLPDDVDIINGGGALLAHGLLAMNGVGEFELQDAALVVSYILCNAESWTVIGGGTDEGGDLGVFVKSPMGALLAQPRALGTWWFVLIDANAPREEIVADMAGSFADASESTGVYVRQLTLHHDRTFSLRQVRNVWGYAEGTSESDTPDTIVEDVDRQAVFTALTQFMDSFPANESIGE